ncbi:MAG: hypothetical protein MJE68_20835, partial [Proteobacteria bacterium]|nr:hypothetical protein [Pseudomonadota bacterium]
QKKKKKMSEAVSANSAQSVAGASTSGRVKISSSSSSNSLPDICVLTDLSRREISMLKAVAKESLKSPYQYYAAGLALGLTYDILSRNKEKPKVELLLAARLLHKDVSSRDFLLEIVNPKVGVSDLRTMYRFVDIIQEYEGSPDMREWAVPPESEKWVEHASAFGFGLFILATLIATIDKLDYEDQIQGPRGSAPSATQFFLSENAENFRTTKGDINVNEFLFQLGLRVNDFKRAAEGSEDVSSWDMRVVTFRALRTLWLSRTKGKPLENIHLFRDLVTSIVNKSPNSYTLRCLICWFLPQRMYEMGGTKLGWVRDNLLKDWRRDRSLIVDDWGANFGF